MLPQSEIQYPDYIETEETIKSDTVLLSPERLIPDSTFTSYTILKITVKALKREKDRHKTIIEVHMEALKQYKNEEWIFHKVEFLEVYLVEFIKEKHITYPDLNNNEQIVENIKSSSDMKKQKILWNKWENESNNDEISSINTEELKFKESSEELYKYIKKKLVVKLFILVLMEVLKERKKEEYIENRKSYFDHYINESNKKNKENHDYVDENYVRKEIEAWTREDNTFVNSVDSENKIDKRDQLIEK
ncbi:STP1 protein [Plasmodium malariae]|uniref:STP1 protein n=1 Tax=Plasmodium malariae TaxID=5858 RepID=A0A1A8WV48_PLAMA|nr:STP1 protein [Plasmodium malariae]